MLNDLFCLLLLDEFLLDLLIHTQTSHGVYSYLTLYNHHRIASYGERNNWPKTIQWL